jgi:hypothetical protein
VPGGRKTASQEQNETRKRQKNKPQKAKNTAPGGNRAGIGGFSAASEVVPKGEQQVTWALAPAILFSVIYNSAAAEAVP